MAIEYRKLLKEYKLTLESDVLDKAFVSKAKEFEEKVKNNELTDDEIKAADDELVELFNTLHDFEPEDSDEVKDLKHEKDVAAARAEVAEADTIDALKGLRDKYEKEVPEVLPVIDKKIEKLEKADNEKKSKDEREALDKLFTVAKKEISECPFDNLQAMGEKYKQYPELVEIIKKRHDDEKPRKDDDELAAKLRSKREWGYKELEALGIKPTGNDMTVVGVRLEKEYLLNIYSVRR